jgi:hypothetical protein
MFLLLMTVNKPDLNKLVNIITGWHCMAAHDPRVLCNGSFWMVIIGIAKRMIIIKLLSTFVLTPLLISYHLGLSIALAEGTCPDSFGITVHLHVG